MPSQAYTSFLRRKPKCRRRLRTPCQCPLRLIHHFYIKSSTSSSALLTVSMPSQAYTSFLHVMHDDLSPIYKDVSMPSQAYTSFLPIPRSRHYRDRGCVNALSGLYIISTVPLQKPRFYAVSRACFCRYLSEYSDSSRFSCMLTFWTYLMRCTYP